jgi:hypothetical protein
MSPDLAITLLLLGAFATVAVALSLQGLWSSLVAIPTVLLSAAVATAWHGPLADYFDRYLSSYTHVLDIVAMLGLFAVAMLPLREITDRASRRRVEFPAMVERLGAPVAASIAAWIFVCFVAMSLQVAPLPPGAVQKTPDTRMFLGISPDRKWLQFVRGSSGSGPFANGSSKFDPAADFLVRHALRRIEFGKEEGLRVNR